MPLGCGRREHDRTADEPQDSPAAKRIIAGSRLLPMVL
jgi:hypothetical protein